jgi:hypothetical protein
MRNRSGTNSQNQIPLNGEITQPSLAYLEHCLTRTALLFSKTLTATEGQAWKEFLIPFSQKAVEWAFDQWQRNGRFFPKPKEIIELCQTFKLGEAGKLEFRSCGSCLGGWVYVYGGKTYGGKDSGKLGTLERCECLKKFIQQHREIAAA